MSDASAPASQIHFFSKVEEAAILYALLREPPVMPSRHATYLELIDLAMRDMPKDPEASLWLHQSASVASTFVRSPMLLSKLLEKMFCAAGAVPAALPAAYSTSVSSAIHAAVCARNFEAVKVLLEAGHPLEQSASRWSGVASDPGAVIQGSIELACAHLVECMRGGDTAGALQLLMIIELFAQRDSQEGQGHGDAALRIVFESLYEVVQKEAESIEFAQSLEIFYRLLDALLRIGADPSIQVHQGQTPLHMAVKANDWRSAAALVAFGADVELPDASGATPIHEAEGSLQSLHSLRAVLRFAEFDKSFFR